MKYYVLKAMESIPANRQENILKALIELQRNGFFDAILIQARGGIADLASSADTGSRKALGRLGVEVAGYQTMIQFTEGMAEYATDYSDNEEGSRK